MSKNSLRLFAVNIVFDVFFAAFLVHEKFLFLENILDDRKSSCYHRKEKNLDTSKKKREIIEKCHFDILFFKIGSLNKVRRVHKAYDRIYNLILLHDNRQQIFYDVGEPKQNDYDKNQNI